MFLFMLQMIRNQSKQVGIIYNGNLKYLGRNKSSKTYERPVYLNVTKQTGVDTHLLAAHSKGRSRWVCVNLKPTLVSITFPSSQCYMVRPCLKETHTLQSLNKPGVIYGAHLQPQHYGGRGRKIGNSKFSWAT